MIHKCIFSSITNLKCTHSNRQMYPWGYMFPRLGTPALADLLPPQSRWWNRHFLNWYQNVWSIDIGQGSLTYIWPAGQVQIQPTKPFYSAWWDILSIIYEIMIYCINKELVNLEYIISQKNDIIDVQSSLVNNLNE